MINFIYLFTYLFRNRYDRVVEILYKCRNMYAKIYKYICKIYNKKKNKKRKMIHNNLGDSIEKN